MNDIVNADYKRMFERQVDITTKRVDELFEERAKCARLERAIEALKTEVEALQIQLSERDAYLRMCALKMAVAEKER